MARFNAETAENYGGTGGHGFFSLQNDKDTARVRFMYRDINDFSGYAVHRVTVGDRERYVNCLREYTDPVEACPFCASGKVQMVKAYIPLYIEEGEGAGTVKLWERGKKFISKISSLCSRYDNLVSHIFEIERNGKKGEQTTTYEIYEMGGDNTTLEDLPEVPDPLGSVILDKTADEMNYYLDNQDFPGAPNNSERHQPAQSREPATRRTPANNQVRRRESF